MRTSLVFALVSFVVLGACGGSSKTGDDQPPDADTGNGDLAPPAYGFQLKSPQIDIMPGQEITYCWYFHTPNTEAMAIKQWQSRMTAGSHHMIMFMTASDLMPEGSLSTSACGFSNPNVNNIPIWTYASQNTDTTQALPSDDGSGTPVGQNVNAKQSGFFQMHYLNATDNVIHAHVTLNAEAYAKGTTVTPAGPYITFNTQISIPAASGGNPGTASASGTCTVDPTEKFYIMSTHAHKQAVETFVKDGSTMVFDSTNWEHPGAKTWAATPFFTFAHGLTYQCNYSNPNAYVIHTGDSAQTDEMCMATGYYFPAPNGKAHVCLNSFLYQ